MADHAHHFLLLTILSLGTILVVFGMKYFSAARQTRLRFAHEGDYRGLAEKTVSLQSASATSLSALQTDVADMKIRLAAVEKMLCEVG